MSTAELYNLIGIAVGVITVIAAGIAVIRTVMTGMRQRREARESKIQKRIEFLREQLRILQNAAAEYEKNTGNVIGIGPAADDRRAARATARSAMQAIGDSELNTIADRLSPAGGDFGKDLEAIADGIKRLAICIVDEAQK